MAAKKPIHELLNMDFDVYEQDYTERYLRWCMNRSKNFDNDLQKVMANRSVANYYNVQFAKLEERFLYAAMPIHTKVDCKIIRSIYASITTEIFLAEDKLNQKQLKMKAENQHAILKMDCRIANKML